MRDLGMVSSNVMWCVSVVCAGCCVCECVRGVVCVSVCGVCCGGCGNYKIKRIYQVIFENAVHHNRCKVSQYRNAVQNFQSCYQIPCVPENTQ